ncbi:hypothetical protein O181_013828 [Austropuccinia psidii MF-1]|uniref:Uncharacterized protein n=1 Tax=Austropuccinia psidii MF-1 TaxID=1389203 RepID=A0A9Q3GNH4_9BASI|nr:hypothetical protein [Austropuccinia psidii MF-1]
MSCTLCAKEGIPCICSLKTTNAFDACQKAQNKSSFVVQPFCQCGQRCSLPRHPCKDSFVINDDEIISEQEWTPRPQTGRQEQFQTISPVPSSINLSTPLLGHFTPQPEQSDYLANEGGL